MPGGTPERRAAIEQLVTGWTPEALAAIIVDIAAVLGASDEWDSQIPEVVNDIVRPLFPGHDPGSMHSYNFWRRVEGD